MYINNYKRINANKDKLISQLASNHLKGELNESYSKQNRGCF